VSAEDWEVLRSGVDLRDNRIEHPERLGAFVAGIARHVIADALRHRRRVVPLSADAVKAAEIPDTLERLVSEAEREGVRRGLARLSDTDRNVLHLSYFEGLSPAEIASRTGEPATRVRKRKSRALERLRRVLFRPEHPMSRRPGGTDKSLGGIALEPY
jgi:RNA polymerase sigma-70 factor (ECF subfamily)